jgi:hypothetical protein
MPQNKRRFKRQQKLVENLRKVLQLLTQNGVTVEVYNNEIGLVSCKPNPGEYAEGDRGDVFENTFFPMPSK